MLVLSAILTAIISPLGTSMLLALFAVSLGVFRWPRSAICSGVFALVWLWVWSMPVLANWASAKVSEDFPPFASEQSIAQLDPAGAIVLLGGGVDPSTATRPWPDLGESSDRVWMAAKLWHARRAPLIVASGGYDPRSHTQSEAEAMRDLLVAFGIPARAIVLESTSRNTRQNATQTARLLDERGLRKILLVTSASHMKRALVHFREAGLEAVPVPTDHASIDFADLRRFVPSAHALELSTRALKEWIGQRVW